MLEYGTSAYSIMTGVLIVPTDMPTSVQLPYNTEGPCYRNPCPLANDPIWGNIGLGWMRRVTNAHWTHVTLTWDRACGGGREPPNPTPTCDVLAVGICTAGNDSRTHVFIEHLCGLVVIVSHGDDCGCAGIGIDGRYDVRIKSESFGFVGRYSHSTVIPSVPIAGGTGPWFSKLGEALASYYLMWEGDRDPPTHGGATTITI